MLKTFKPVSALLQKYVELFYVFTNDKPEHFSYIAFPHINTAISFFKGVKITRGDWEVNIETDTRSDNQYVIEILGKYTQPVFVNYRGDFEEIAVVFKPYGINQFLLEEILKISPAFSQEMKSSLWRAFAVTLFRETNPDLRIEILEDFLLNNLQENTDPRISKAISYLESVESDYSVEAVAALTGMHSKSFQRLFLKNMTCTPSEYKRIARFRHSVNTRLLSKEIKTLTHISYESNYYDQSYFIREFKKLTHLSPKKFFDTLLLLDEKQIVWKIK